MAKKISPKRDVAPTPGLAVHADEVFSRWMRPQETLAQFGDLDAKGRLRARVFLEMLIEPQELGRGASVRLLRSWRRQVSEHNSIIL